MLEFRFASAEQYAGCHWWSKSSIFWWCQWWNLTAKQPEKGPFGKLEKEKHLEINTKVQVPFCKFRKCVLFNAFNMHYQLTSMATKVWMQQRMQMPPVHPGMFVILNWRLELTKGIKVLIFLCAKNIKFHFATCCGQWFLWPLEVSVILFDGFDYIFQQGIPTILDQTSHEHPPLSSLAWPCLFNILSLSHSWTFLCTDDGWLYIPFAYRIHPTWEPR